MPQYLPKEVLKTKEKYKKQKATVNCHFLSELKKKKVVFFTSEKIWKHTQKANKVKGIRDHFASISTYVWVVQKACKECAVVAGICKPVNCTMREDTQILRS